MKISQTPRPQKFSPVILLALLFAANCLLVTTAHAQTERVIYNFVPRTGSGPAGALILEAQGNLYGTVIQGLEHAGHGAVFELSSAGAVWTQTNLATFEPAKNGWFPAAGVISQSGALFGTTLNGGPGSAACSEGCGTVFRLTQVSEGVWDETVLHNFVGGTDGNQPRGGLISDAHGNLYGTTAYGGDHNFGIVFKLSSPDWKESILHTFTGGIDGGVPSASLAIDASGDLYGTTFSGGNINDCPKTAGCGVAFELSNSGGFWKETLLHTFTGATDGANPLSNLVFDADGNLYGTTSAAGNLTACYGGCGTAFELSPGSRGWKTTVTHTFVGGRDGANPAAGLIFDAAGNLYGTTENGGDLIGPCASQGCGIVFELSPSNGRWNLNPLHAFTNNGDGSSPTSSLVFDAAGNLYGTTGIGGANGSGTAFEITP